jgi:hypothetical protein
MALRSPAAFRGLAGCASRPAFHRLNSRRCGGGGPLAGHRDELKATIGCNQHVRAAMRVKLFPLRALIERCQLCCRPYVNV